MDYIVTIGGYKTKFKVFQIGTNVNPFDRGSLHAYLLRTYVIYVRNSGMQHRVMGNHYKVVTDTDMFELYPILPPQLGVLVDELNEAEDYDAIANLLTKFEALGYTFDYGLDAVAHDLRAI